MVARMLRIEQRHKRFRIVNGCFPDLFILGVLIIVPQDAGPETARPIINIDFIPVCGIRIDATGHQSGTFDGIQCFLYLRVTIR